MNDALNGLSGRRGGRGLLAWLSPKHVAAMVRRRLLLFVAVLLGTVGTVYVVTLLQPLLYRADAEVVLGGDPATEIARLRSRDMAAQVATALGLDRSAAFLAPRDPWQRARALLHVRPAVAGRADPNEVVDRLIADLSVEQPSDTVSLTIGYTAPDPETAARVANAYAGLYTGGAVPSPTGAAAPTSRIVSAAAPPAAAESTRPLTTLGLAAALGCGLGLIAALLAEAIFGGLTSAEEVRDRLWLHYLGRAPLLSSALPNARSPIDAVVEFPKSAYAEAFRGVLVAVRRTGTERTRVIALTAARRSEGKATTAICLARTVALTRETVALVDCDPRGGVGAMLGAGMGPGLSEVLDGSASLDAALVRDKASGAFVLGHGRAPDRLAEALTAPAIAELVAALRQRFGLVMIVTGTPGSDGVAQRLGAAADIVMLVVRWRATTIRAVKAMLRQFNGHDARIAGIVLSQVDMRRQGKYSAEEASLYERKFAKYYS